jgi:hypothetical protein
LSRSRAVRWCAQVPGTDDPERSRFPAQLAVTRGTGCSSGRRGHCSLIRGWRAPPRPAFRAPPCSSRMSVPLGQRPRKRPGWPRHTRTPALPGQSGQPGLRPGTRAYADHSIPAPAAWAVAPTRCQQAAEDSMIGQLVPNLINLFWTLAPWPSGTVGGRQKGPGICHRPANRHQGADHSSWRGE